MGVEGVKKEAKVKRAGSRAPGGAGGSLAARLRNIISEMKERPSEADFNERLGRMIREIGDGSALFEKESVEAFDAGLSPGGSDLSGALGPKSKKGRTGMDNLLASVGLDPRGAAWELGLLALAESPALGRASEKQKHEAFRQAQEALLYQNRWRPLRLAKAYFNHPSRQEGLFGEGAGIDDWMESAIYKASHDSPSAARAEARGALEELLGALEGSPELLARAGEELGRGSLLLKLAEFDSDMACEEGERLCAWLQKKAREWIEKGLDWPEPGELAAALCEGMECADIFGAASAPMEIALTLQTAMAAGMGVRRQEGDQPLKLLLDMAEPEDGNAAAFALAAEALIQAGAGESDLVEGVDKVLKEAENQTLAARLLAERERREIERGLGELSAEEAKAVAEFLRERRAAQGRSEPAPRPRKPGL